MTADGGVSDARSTAHRLWCAPHRPLFLFAAIWALVAPSVWWFHAGFGPDPVLWHARELLFGTGGAAVGGFLLTALPSWTRSHGVRPGVTVALSILWLAARTAPALEDGLPWPAVAILTGGYFGLLATVIARHLWAARLWRKAWVVPVVLAAGFCNVALVIRPESFDANASAAAAPLLFALLISLVGGRAVPAFTRSWMRWSGAGGAIVDRLVLAALANTGLAAACILAALGLNKPSGVCLIGAGVLTLARTARWRSLSTARYPALCLLHLAWLWLPVGLLLTGAAQLQPAFMEPVHAVHGLTMGAMGTMLVAFMGRASMKRSGCTLQVSAALSLAFALVWLSAIWRVAGPFVAVDLRLVVPGSALLWMLGWSLFLLDYVPSLLRPSPWPVFSARLSVHPSTMAPKLPVTVPSVLDQLERTGN